MTLDPSLDQSLGAPEHADAPQAHHTAHAQEVPLAHSATEPLRMLSVEELLEQARRPERTAQLCLRADLYADLHAATEELAGLVDSDGVPLEDSEGAMSDTTPAGKALALQQRVRDLEQQIAAAMRQARFRALPSDEWPVFVKTHSPKTADDDGTEFDIQLVAATAVDPALTVEQVRAIRKVINHAQWKDLANAAFAANRHGGVDVPFSKPGSPRQKGS